MKVDAGTSNEASYSYGANNGRVKKVVGSGASAVTTYYVWEGAQVIAEYSNAAASSGGTSYYLADRLSTRMITEANGAFKGTQDHLAFGEDGGTTGTSEKHRFTNYERDNESGSDYAINRQYDLARGRFMQADPIHGSILDPQSLNSYTYVTNDPQSFVDPLGLDKKNEGKCFIVVGGRVVEVPCAKDDAPFDPNDPPLVLRGWADYPFAPFLDGSDSSSWYSGGGFGGLARERRRIPPIACPLDPRSLRVPNGRPPEAPWSRLNPPDRLAPPQSLSPRPPQFPGPVQAQPGTGTPSNPGMYPRVSPTDPMIPQDPSFWWKARFISAEALRMFGAVFKAAARSAGEGFGFVMVDPCLVDRRYCGCRRVSEDTVY